MNTENNEARLAPGPLTKTSEEILELLGRAMSMATGASRMVPYSFRGSQLHRCVVLSAIERKLLDAAFCVSRARDLVV